MIVYIQYTNPAGYPPLEHSSRIFADGGMNVLFLGTGSAGKSDGFEFEPHKNISIKKWKYCPPSWFQKFHYLAFCVWASFIAWSSGAKWVYASDLFSCPAAILSQKIFGLKIIYHEHDSPNLVKEKCSWFGKYLSYFRAWIGKSANIVVFPNETRAALFREETGRTGPIHIVWNVPSLDEIEYCQNYQPLNPVLFYHGSLNEKRLPTSVLDALKMLDPNVQLIFAGYTAGISFDYSEWYLSEASKRGLEKRVRYLGPIIDRKSLLTECCRASIGLAFMPKVTDDINMKNMTGASNKPFDYLACGLDLIVSELPDWVQFYVNPGLAISCDPQNAKSIADSVNSILVYNKNDGYIKNLLRAEWNYEYQFHDVYALVAK